MIDLRVDVSTEKFLKTIDENPSAIVGLSALLTTTMGNIKKTGTTLKKTDAMANKKTEMEVIK